MTALSMRNFAGDVTLFGFWVTLRQSQPAGQIVKYLGKGARLRFKDNVCTLKSEHASAWAAGRVWLP